MIKVPVAHPESDGTTHRDGRPYRLRPPGEYRFVLERLGLRQSAAWDEEHAATGSSWQVQVYVAPAGGQLQPIETVESILWDDRKVNTYTFALVRALAELAVTRSARGRWSSDGRVRIPVADIAERWISFYWSLVEPRAEQTILLGQRVSGRQDMAFRAALAELAGRWEELGGYAGQRQQVRPPARAQGAGRLTRTHHRKLGDSVEGGAGHVSCAQRAHPWRRARRLRAQSAGGALQPVSQLGGVYRRQPRRRALGSGGVVVGGALNDMAPVSGGSPRKGTDHKPACPTLATTMKQPILWIHGPLASPP